MKKVLNENDFKVIEYCNNQINSITNLNSIAKGVNIHNTTVYNSFVKLLKLWIIDEDFNIKKLPLLADCHISIWGRLYPLWILEDKINDFKNLYFSYLK